MKINYLILIIFLTIFNFSISRANDKVAFIDLNYILTESISGKKILNQLETKNNMNLEFFNSEEEILKKEKEEIDKLQNILSSEEYNNKINLFKNKVDLYKKKKLEIIEVFEGSKNKELKLFFSNLNLIMNTFMQENSINVIFDKKNIVMANNENDISNQILQLVNKNDTSQ